MMKKVFTLLCVFLLALSVQAQREVTKFLGIPVDGTKSAMIQKLEAKGFEVVDREKGTLMGEFNGVQSYVAIVTQGNKVWRIATFAVGSRSKGQTILRFNELCRQFEAKPLYVAARDEQYIDEDEDISHEINVHDKQYHADFYQKDSAGKVDENRLVWLSIGKSVSGYGNFVIYIYYDNVCNQAHGEDL